MANQTFVFQEGQHALMTGALDWDTTTNIRCALLAATVTPDPDDNAADTQYSIQGTSYLATPASRTATIDDSNNRVRYDMTSPVTFTAVVAGNAVDKMLVYWDADGGGEAAIETADLYIACFEFTSLTPNGGDITVTLSTSPDAAFIGTNTVS